MKNEEAKQPTNIEKLKEAAAKTDNPQMKRAIENRMNTIEKDKTVYK